MFGERDLAVDEEVVGEEIEASLRGDRGIENAHGSRSRIAWIDEQLSADLFLFTIQGVEGFAGHHDFAADFQIGGEFYLFQGGRVYAKRNGADGFHVWGDIFSGGAVATGDSADQDAILVLERDTETVELVLGDVLDVLAAGALANPAIPVAKGVVGEGIVEAEHGAGVANSSKALAGCAAYANSGRIGRDQLGIGGL